MSTIYKHAIMLLPKVVSTALTRLSEEDRVMVVVALRAHFSFHWASLMSIATPASLVSRTGSAADRDTTAAATAIVKRR